MTIKEAKDIVFDLPSRDLLEQLAEEASELAKAALKAIRACGWSENPTPVTTEESIAALEDEAVDVLMCIDTVLGLDHVVKNAHSSPKWIRWAKRIEDAEEAANRGR